MELLDKVRDKLGLYSKDEFICADETSFVDPDDFCNFSEYDSLMVDSKEGAPE